MASSIDFEAEQRFEQFRAECRRVGIVFEEGLIPSRDRDVRPFVFIPNEDDDVAPVNRAPSSKAFVVARSTTAILEISRFPERGGWAIFPK